MSEKSISNGIKSKDRVKENGEVYTPDRIVNDMLDLVDEELLTDIDLSTDSGRLEYIKKVFLEPSCGDGQFLIRILYRKLMQVKALEHFDKQQASIMALVSIYGIDIEKDNVEESRIRMKALLLNHNVSTFGVNKNDGQIKKNYINTGKIGVTIYSEDKAKEYIKMIDTILCNNIKIGDTTKENSITFFEYFWRDDKLAIKKDYLEVESEQPADDEYIYYIDAIKKYYNDSNNEMCIDIGSNESKAVLERYEEKSTEKGTATKSTRGNKSNTAMNTYNRMKL